MALLRQAFALEPFLDQGRDLEIVLVHHHHMRIALDACLREIDDVDAAAGRLDGVRKGDAVGADLGPARIALDIVAVDDEGRDVLQHIRFGGIADAGRLDRNQRLDLVRAGLRDLEAEGAGLAVEQKHRGADAIDLSDIGGDGRIVGRGPARYVLLDEILVTSTGNWLPGNNFRLAGSGSYEFGPSPMRKRSNGLAVVR